MNKNKNIITINNCIYVGEVFHARVKPKIHKFKYKIFYLNFDLIKINEVFRKVPILSINKLNLLSFYFRDHGPFKCKNLVSWVKKTLKANSINKKIESIYLLTCPRLLGYVFNPLSIYTCLDKNGQVIAQIYEVHNTFKQRHFYLTKNTFNEKFHNRKIKKEFHVSPFMSITGYYKFKSFINKSKLTINILYYGKHGDLLATFSGNRKELNTTNLLSNTFKRPFMTLKITLGIHLEAIFLFLKRLTFFKCPPIKKNVISNNLNEK